MFKRAIFALLALSLLGVFSVFAQDSTVDPAAYVPADFAGFIRLKVGEDPAETQRRLNIALFVARNMEPARVQLPTSGYTYDTFLPFTAMFDAEGVTFASTVLRWLNGDVVLAYRSFNGAFETEADDVLAILPNTAVLEATAGLSAVIQAQDLPQKETYRGIPLYIGDKTTIAITSPAVFIGPTDLVKQALDIQAGVSQPLTVDPAYQALPWSESEDTFISAYVTKDYILPAVNGLLNGVVESQDMVQAFGEALGNIQPETSFESALLNSMFDSAGVSLSWNQETGNFTASVHFYSPELPQTIHSSDFDTDLLTMIPRNAMLVQTGDDLTGFLYQAMTSVPLSNFARQVYPGLPIPVAGTDNALAPAPDAQQIQDSVNGFLTALESLSNFSIEQNLFSHLLGNYAIAMMPRPNNPVPVINTPFDLLMIAEVDDAEKAQAGTSQLLQALFSLKPRALDPVDNWEFLALSTDAESAPVFTLAFQDDLLILGTGDAVQAALAAARGDNRLIEQDNWKSLNETARPDLFLDTEMFYNTFFPELVGGSSTDDRTRLGLYLSTPEPNLVKLDLTVILSVN